MDRRRRHILTGLAVFAVAGVGWQTVLYQGDDGDGRARARAPAPVEVAAVSRGTIELRRTFSGSLEALAQFDAAPKVGGRIERLAVDVGDRVRRGQVVAELDNDEFVQEVALAEAELAVARANVAEARSRASSAQRTLERTLTLGERGVASESQLDTVKLENESAAAALQVASAQVTRAEATLATARIRLGYTQVTASWVGGRDERVVAARFVDPGDTVSENTPLLSIVEIQPIKAVVSVTERDYARLAVGMPAALATDAHPNRSFDANVSRISPVFQEASRQAWVELLAENADQALKPGMFVRATLVLDRALDAWIVPEAALARRAGEDGVFVVDAAGSRVTWRVVEIGIRNSGRVSITSESDLGERVVTLGQQLLDDGSPIVIPNAAPGSRSAPPGGVPDQDAASTVRPHASGGSGS